MFKIIISFLMIGFLTSCGKDGVYPEITNKTWKVSFFSDDAKDETSKFAGYTFEFKTDGTFVANFTSSNPVKGTWKITEANKELVITISGNDKLEDVSEDWEIVNITDTTIRLTDDDDLDDEILEFTKN